MNTIENLLRENPHVDGWRISETATKSYELFFVHRKLETVRSTDTVETGVTVYVDHDGAMGDSSFAVYASMTEKDIAGKIESAVARARLVSNQPYQLPEGGVLNAGLPTNMKDQDMKALGLRIADAVFAADTMEGGSINACEIFLYRDTLHVKNHRGVDKTQVVHRVMIEAIPTFTDPTQSVELYEDYRFTEFDPAAVTAEIAEKMREVRDRANAVKPETPMTVNVLLRPQEIHELLSNLADDANYAAVYARANVFQLGDDLQQGSTGDKLTFNLKSILSGCDKSSYFDADGTSLRDACIVRDGKVNSYYGSSRFAQYLDIPDPTGDLPSCVSVQPGTLGQDELKKEPYVECVSLSGLQVDLYNDYIGGEIRLAYYFDGKKTVPVTGITMSGKLSDALKGMRLSASACVSGPYEGPRRMLIRNMAVL